MSEHEITPEMMDDATTRALFGDTETGKSELAASSGSLPWVRYPANGLYVSGEWEIHNSASEGSRTGPFMLLKCGELIGSFDRLHEAKRHAETAENTEVSDAGH